MIEALSNFDKVTAAGILARAALALAHSTNPAAAPAVADELSVRRVVIQQVRKQAGVAPDDNSEDALQRIEERLDSETDSLLGEVNDVAALDKRALDGTLPSDLYSVELVPNIADALGHRFQQERTLIEKTIKASDREQHVAPTEENNGEVFAISLFSKYFPDKFPGRSFTMLVVAERRGFQLVVHQAWRLYPNEVDISEATDLVDMLRRFAKVYGVEIEHQGVKSKFIFRGEVPLGATVAESYKFRLRHSKITLSHFYKRDPATGRGWVALVVGADINQYRKTLSAYSSEAAA